jgi:amino acid adenylation domain-containing protein
MDQVTQRVAGRYFIERFEAAVKNNPAAIALKINQHQLSYLEIQRRAISFANNLVKLIDPKVDGIVLYLARTTELIVTLLACQYLGKPYVPIDIRTPENRLKKVVSASHYLVLYDGLTTKENNKLWLDIKSLSEHNEPSETLSFDAAQSEEVYRIYTSGSTGEPKGVRVLKRGCDNLIQAFSNLMAAGPKSHWLSATSISFDIFYLEYTLPLSHGATLILLEDAQIWSPQIIARQLVSNQPQVFQATPSMFKSLLPYLPENWRFNQLLVGGEALGQRLSTQLFFRSHWLCNVYGPTETTVWSTAHLITKAGDVRIGKPIERTIIKILDDKYQPSGEQMPGRIFIGGDGVALDYFNNPQLTAEKFLMLNYEGERLRFYDTGDIGFYDADGVLNYLNRDGDFFKINGYRVECGEIVDALEKIPRVHQAAVILVAGDTEQGGKLVGWLKTENGVEVADISTLRFHLEQQLCHYMIPSHFFFTAQLPCTMSGKLDSNKLIAMSEEKLQQAIVGKNLVASSFEKIAVQHPAMSALRNYIETNELTAEGNFFHYGLSSMQAISFHLELMELYPQIELHELFERPTLASLLAPYDETRMNQSAICPLPKFD